MKLDKAVGTRFIASTSGRLPQGGRDSSRPYCFVKLDEIPFLVILSAAKNLTFSVVSSPHVRFFPALRMTGKGSMTFEKLLGT